MALKKKIFISSSVVSLLHNNKLEFEGGLPVKLIKIFQMSYSSRLYPKK